MIRFSKSEIITFKKTYVPNLRIELDSIDDPYSKLKQGDKGIITCVDDMGTIHVNWDCGSTLGVIPYVDSFHIVKEN